jgi:RNA polymerase sigma-70 factor, ECF subfamily
VDVTERDDDFDSLFHSGYAPLVGQLTAYLGDRTEAEDVAQDAFLRAWQRWESLSRYDDPVAWVHRVAWNLATSRWRRIAMAARVLRGQPAPEPTPGLGPDLTAQAVGQASCGQGDGRSPTSSASRARRRRPVTR